MHSLLTNRPGSLREGGLLLPVPGVQLLPLLPGGPDGPDAAAPRNPGCGDLGHER